MVTKNGIRVSVELLLAVLIVMMGKVLAVIPIELGMLGLLGIGVPMGMGKILLLGI